MQTQSSIALLAFTLYLYGAILTTLNHGVLINITVSWLAINSATTDADLVKILSLIPAMATGATFTCDRGSQLLPRYSREEDDEDDECERWRWVAVVFLWWLRLLLLPPMAVVDCRPPSRFFVSHVVDDDDDGSLLLLLLLLPVSSVSESASSLWLSNTSVTHRTFTASSRVPS